MLSTVPDGLPTNFEIYSFNGFIYGDYYEKNSFVFNGYTFNDWSVWMQYEGG